MSSASGAPVRGRAGAAHRYRRSLRERDRRLVGKLDREPEAPAHGFDVAAPSRDHEIAALFELGDRGLAMPRLSASCA
jgi:hypothetical protein